MVDVVKELYVDSESRLFIVSDIHGEFKLLESSLQQLGFKEGKDILVCVGDLIDRGDESEKTLRKFLFDCSGSYYSVRGNHDEFMVDNNWDLQFYNGGSWILDTDYESRVAYGEIINKILPYAIEIHYNGKVYGVVHAEVPLEFSSWDDFCEVLQHNSRLKQECLWNREIVEFQNSYKDAHLEGVDFVFHGHTPVNEPKAVANRHYIDTGAVFKNGYLTVVEIIKDDFIFHKFKE